MYQPWADWLTPRPRRDCLWSMAAGLNGIALTSLLAREACAGSPATGRGAAGVERGPLPARTPRAKSVIWLFMNGGVSHMESFDPKPALSEYGGKTINETPYADALNPERLKIARVVVKGDANGQQRLTLYPLQTGFRPYGESGLLVSDYFPEIGSCVDDIAIVRSMYTTDDNHGAQTQFHSGRHMLDGEFPTLGAWVHYGLGSLNDNLPQFISMGNREYWNAKDGHYLGPEHDAIPVRVDPSNPLDFARPAGGHSQAEQRIGFSLVNRLNQMRAREQPGDGALAARIRAYELAFRMQTSIPDVLRFEDETAETQSLYGLDQPETAPFGQQLLAARRLVERGVRFVQIQHGAGGAGVWDAHGGLKDNHSRNARQVDRPIAALLRDLKRRGLLDETLVVFATEFGRTPGSQGADGRDHHIFGFSVWLAGGGIRGGMAHGATDEIGFHAVENRHYVTDIHATILHQLGLDSRQLEIPGRKRLEIDHGHPIHEIIA